MMAIHLVKSYCLPALVYGCEVCSLTPVDMRAAKGARNNSFRKVLMLVGEEVLIRYCFTVMNCHDVFN